MRTQRQRQATDARGIHKRKVLRRKVARQQLKQFGCVQFLPWRWVHGVLYDAKNRALASVSDSAVGLAGLEKRKPKSARPDRHQDLDDWRHPRQSEPVVAQRRRRSIWDY